MVGISHGFVSAEVEYVLTTIIIVNDVLGAVACELVQSVTKPDTAAAAEQSVEVQRWNISRYFPAVPSDAPLVNRTTPNPLSTFATYTGLFASTDCISASTCTLLPPATFLKMISTS